MSLRVQFIHGLESSPQSAKARLFERHFDARTPAMDTSDFEACVTLQSDFARSFQPDVLVGSSFGGGVALAMLQRGSWRGPTLLLAQAGLRQGLAAELPARVRIWIAHGLEDDIVDPADSRALLAAGDPHWVKGIEVEDDHPLHGAVESEALVDWIRQLAAEAAGDR